MMLQFSRYICYKTVYMHKRQKKCIYFKDEWYNCRRFMKFVFKISLKTVNVLKSFSQNDTFNTLRGKSVVNKTLAVER